MVNAELLLRRIECSSVKEFGTQTKSELKDGRKFMEGLWV
jgi:hypothetical protein